MSGKWEHVGPSNNIAAQMLGLFTGIILCTKETIRLLETGEYREVYVTAGQSIRGAVDCNQFTDLAQKGSKLFIRG